MGSSSNKTKRKEEVDTLHADPIPESISEQLYDSIVNIRFINSKNTEQNATGFFMKININDIIYKYLLTNKHVISDLDINDKITINLVFGKKNKEQEIKIKLDSGMRFIKTFKEDVTVIEVIKVDNIGEEKYLTPDLNYEHGFKRYLNNNFYLAGYPRNFGERCISSGKILGISEEVDYEFEHTLFTLGGSSGSPICNLKGDLIGIHTGGIVSVENEEEKRINYGVFIGHIILNLKEEVKKINMWNKNYIIAEICIEESMINENIKIINSYEQKQKEDPDVNLDNNNKGNEKEIQENI